MLLNSFSASVGVVAAQTLWKALSNVRRIPSSCGSGVAIRFVPYGVGVHAIRHATCGQGPGSATPGPGRGRRSATARAESWGVPEPLQPPLDIAATGPGPDHVVGDPALVSRGQDPGALALAARGQAPVQVHGRAQVVAGRPVRVRGAQALVQVDQVADRGAPRSSSLAHRSRYALQARNTITPASIESGTIAPM